MSTEHGVLTRRAAGSGLLVVLALLLTAACRQDMHDQPRFEPLEAGPFFDDGRSARPHIPGTVARGTLRLDELLYTGRIEGRLADLFPFPVTREVLERGRERFNVFCSPCHDGLGYGQGMIVRRGFRPPPSFHQDRLRQASAGHFFDVITNGFGVMKDYSDRVPVADRWAIVAYIRALQLSQHAALDDVPPAERQELEENEQ